MIITRLVEMPSSVNGFLMIDPDGNGNIYLNKDKDRETLIKAWYHELRHYLAGHMSDYGKPVSVCEAEAEKGKDPAPCSIAESFPLSEYCYPI